MTFQELLAAQVASGGQNVITPDNAGRILGLAAQQEANRRLALAEGQQAVQEAINRQIASGERAAPDKDGKMDQYGQYVSPLQRSGQVVTAPSGVKFVTDAQGNVIGTNAPLTPLGPKQYAGESMQEARQAFNRGESTQAERDAFRQNMFGDARSPGLIQKTFIQEMQKQAPKPQDTAKQTPVADVSRGIESLVPNVASIVSPGIGVRAPALPTSPEEAKKLQADKQRMENLLYTSAFVTEPQKAEDRSRAGLYREMQKLQGELSSGEAQVEYDDPIGGRGVTTLPLSPEQRAEAQQRVDQLREEIAKSGKRSSGIASKTATPRAKLEEYRALLEALARAQQ